MGTLYYYNNYYSRKENCGDYMTHDYCANNAESTSKKSYFGTFIGIAACVCCCICIFKFDKIKEKCCSSRCCKKSDSDK